MGGALLGHNWVRHYQRLLSYSLFKFWEGAGWRQRGIELHYVAKPDFEGFKFPAVPLPLSQQSWAEAVVQLLFLQRTQLLFPAMWGSSWAQKTLASGDLTPSSGPRRYPHAQQAVISWSRDLKFQVSAMLVLSRSSEGIMCSLSHS